VIAVRVNAQPREIPAATAVAALVRELVGDDPQGVAVAVNGSVVPRARWGEVMLANGDTVELVRAVQGG
jgi:sulfur carrier protein